MTNARSKKEDNDVRDGFIFYESFRSAMKDLPAETQLLLYNAIADYALYDIEPDFDTNGIARGFFALMRPQIDANNRRRDAGARGGRPVKSQESEPNEHQTETNEEPNRNLGVTDEKPNGNLGVTEAKPSNNQTVTKPEPKEKEKAKEKPKGNDKEKENAKAFCADKPRRFTKPAVEDISLSSYRWINQLQKNLLPDYAKANLHTNLDLTYIRRFVLTGRCN